MAQRTIQIYVNDRLYKEVTVEVDDTGAYNVADVLAMINTDREAGYFDDWGIPPGTFPVRVQLHR